VDKSRSRNQGGTGLGLAIVKHILGAHDRRLMVESTPGEGSTFGFTLPSAPRPVVKQLA
jgi:two-component system phosphate regulon sensor histidine kinase PhoR